MNTDKIDKAAANHLRKAIKELRWAAFNLERFYSIVKPNDAPIIDRSPNQLEMFADYGKEKEG